MLFKLLYWWSLVIYHRKPVEYPFLHSKPLHTNQSFYPFSVFFIPIFLKFYLFYFLKKFWPCESWLLCRLFSSCDKQGLFSNCGKWASHGSGFSFCRAEALGKWASVVVVPGLSC